jgi:50S ribosomal protein L16 3-hydroxylase
MDDLGLPDATYRDPRLSPAQRAGLIPGGMVAFAAQVLDRIRWSRADVVRFLGEYLTMPKPHVVFRPTPAQGTLIRLDPKTQLLYYGDCFFINGESFSLAKRHRTLMRQLADRRQGDVISLAGQAKLIGEWRRAGYVHLQKRNG